MFFERTVNSNQRVGTEINRSDEVVALLSKSWNELFAMDRGEVEALQLRAARQRFDSLVPKIKALKTQADNSGCTEIRKLVDLAPLLFDHRAYKSYPLALLEQNRFDMLTKWLAGMTSLDLSGVDASGCEGIDHWLDTLECQVPLQIFHTSGTTGKMSFFPRTVMEQYLYGEAFFKPLDVFRDEPGDKLGGKNGAKMSVVHPSARHGRSVVQHLLKYLSAEVAPKAEDCHVLSEGIWSADLISLFGRIRVAQAKGEVDKIKLSDKKRLALKRFLEEQGRRPREMADFFGRMVEKLRGRRVFMTLQATFLFQASREGLNKGVRRVFAPNSLCLTGGDGKGVAMTPNWVEMSHEFTGMNIKLAYAMTELIGAIPRCPTGNYHMVPYHVPFLLDPENGTMLPREGTQTGRFAALDLLAQTYWGGLITGDKVTIEWDNACPCGRKGVFAHDDITRYAASVTGDDKVTCSATIDNSDVNLQRLLDGTDQGIARA